VQPAAAMMEAAMMEAAMMATLCLLLLSPDVAKAAGSPVKKARLRLFPMAQWLASSLVLGPLASRRLLVSIHQ
jgi:hypothetical protein